MARARRPSVSLILSYIFDWVIIIALAGAGGGLNFIQPYMRPFSLLDLDISYPYIPNQIITVGTLVLVSLVAPAFVVAFVTAFFVPGWHFAKARGWSKKKILMAKLWELEKGWAGLALSCAGAFFVTQAAKNLFGKPRPDFLDRCQPDLGNLQRYIVGGYGQDISARWTLVTSAICTTTDQALIRDGFRSFPSGHSSFSWAGLLYLTLFLCAKLNIAIPYLPLQPEPSDALERRKKMDLELLPMHNHGPSNEIDNRKSEDAMLSTQPHGTEGPLKRDGRLHPSNIKDLAAAPPNYLLIVAFFPVGVAFYICSTRYVQYWHHGFDIIFGALIGILTAWFSFRWYHLPLSRGQGWAWGARSSNRAWGIGVGTGGYVDREDLLRRREASRNGGNGNGAVPTGENAV